ncbi:hypothetical protein [Mycolicibacterium sp. CBMA 361]|uniref:phage tail tube protein n=1 Tax=Mycolicibacterium sp. CBMA 361 TaxID=2606610 RepID=UPI001EF0F11F|nr:hypothetical protein [Mycolicibacterium sp. CBMA 361]
MTANNKNVYAAEPLATGTCFVAETGTTGPTNASASLNPGFTDLGNIGEDGFTESMARTTDEKKNFGGKIVKVLQTEYKHTFKFVLMESLNADVLKAVYGADNVTVTAANGTHGTQVKITKNGKRLGHFSWVIDTTDSELNSGVLRRRLGQLRLHLHRRRPEDHVRLVTNCRRGGFVTLCSQTATAPAAFGCADQPTI